MRESIFAVVLFIAGCIVVWGLAGWNTIVAKVCAGLLLAGWGWLVLADDGEST